ncbi:hypothetical protein [Pedobacter miscanthi]|uniref:Uncharacterized protein n=1 Tax=Pedobacter miscanthi TaxID=2259170 RepID=A0A366KK77_9SPHI|nr:hypothetical protein [Pedobacter miscanthi]RBQ01930.1 hypothetical protein DRW42_28025 [Pedobacter miscanthi]
MNYRSLLLDDSGTAPEVEKLAGETEKANQPIQFDGNFGLEKKIGKEGNVLNYGLTILFEEEKQAHEVKYELSLTYLGLNQEQNFLYRLDRTSAVYVNEVIPELVADKLAYQAGSIFYPLIVETKPDGKFLKVTNCDEIRKRWVKVRSEIENYFEGDYAAKYIRLMNERLMDDNFIQICFREDWFIQTYFQSIYKNYKQQLTVEENLLFPNLEPTALGYKTVETVNPFTNYFGALQLEHKGILEQDEINSATGGYRAKYILSPATKVIQIIIAEWWVKEITEKKVTLKLFSTDKFDDEKLPTNVASSSIESLVFLDGDKTNKREKSFWGSWFK